MHLNSSRTMPHQKFSLIEERNYIKIAIYFENSDDHVDVKQLKFFLDNTLKTAFGIIGASVSDFDILSLRKKSANSNEPITVLLRVHCDGLKTLWGAITMCTTLNGKLCKLEVLHVGDSLMDMASERYM